MRNKIIISAVAISLFIGGTFFVWKERTLTTNLPQTGEDNPEPLASMNTWKAYKNEEYGFEYQLPSEWELDNASLLMSVFYFKTKDFKPVLLGYAPSKENEPIYSVGEISVWVSDNPKNLSIKDRYLRYDDASRLLFVDEVKQQYKESKIHGNDYIEFEPYWDQNPSENFGANHKISILKLGEYIIQFEYIYGESGDPSIEENLRRVINSFRLSSPDIADWKVYRNDEYGFELKYPADWEAPKNFQKIGGVPTLLISPESYFEGCCTGLKIEVREGDLEEVHKKMLLDYPKEDILSDKLISFNGNQGREIVFLTHYGDKNERVWAVTLNNGKSTSVLRWGDGDSLVDQVVATLKLNK